MPLQYNILKKEKSAMSALKKLSVFVCTVIGVFPSRGADDDMTVSNKENYPFTFASSEKEDVPMKAFRQQIVDIAEEIKEAHEEADVKRVGRAYRAFEKLKFKDEVWEALGQSLKVVK